MHLISERPITAFIGFSNFEVWGIEPSAKGVTLNFRNLDIFVERLGLQSRCLWGLTWTRSPHVVRDLPDWESLPFWNALTWRVYLVAWHSWPINWSHLSLAPKRCDWQTGLDKVHFYRIFATNLGTSGEIWFDWSFANFEQVTSLCCVGTWSYSVVIRWLRPGPYLRRPQKCMDCWKPLMAVGLLLVPPKAPHSKGLVLKPSSLRRGPWSTLLCPLLPYASRPYRRP